MNLLDRLGIKLPIIQAPMAGVQDSQLAGAVAGAGGLGSLPCAMLSLDTIREQLEDFRSRTASPVNLNFFCHRNAVADAAGEQAWRKLLTPYYREFGLDPEAITPGPQRKPFDAQAASLMEQCKPEVVSFHFGLPSRELLQRVKSAGALVWSSATTLQEALWLESRGVDAVIAQGLEAGGHRGHFLHTDTTGQANALDLLARVEPALKVPVIAAGGFADSERIAEAMALGAAAVQVGTAYLLCPEARTSAVHRAALADATIRETVLTNLFSGRPARALVNRLISELGPTNPAAPGFPLASTALGPLRAQAEKNGSGDFSPLWAGQGYQACREVPAGQLTRELASGLA